MVKNGKHVGPNIFFHLCTLLKVLVDHLKR